MMKYDRLTALLLALSLGLTPAGARAQDTPAAAYEAQQIAVIDQGLDLMSHSVHYPVLTGMADPALQEEINARIVVALDAEALLARLTAVMNLTTPLTVTYDAMLTSDVFSCKLSACGPVRDNRTTHVWYTVNIDLLTGEVITLDDLFDDADAEREAIEDYLSYEIAPTLSAHLQNSDLTPLPEQFSITPEGLTFCYPIRQLSTLSDRAGAVTLRWCELEGLRTEPGSVPERIGAAAHLTLDDTSRSRIEASVQSGSLPGIPAVLGASLKEATDRYRLLIDPDLCEGGRLFSLEDAAFRNVYLITDSFGRTWDDSVILGIRADTLCLHGLCIGLTTRKAWLQALGEPDASAVLDEDRADAWRLPCGISDYYQLGDYRLRLHADEDGVLVSVFLTR